MILKNSIFFKETSFTPNQINPILEEVGSAKVNQGGKLFKVFSRPKVTLDMLRNLKVVSEFVESNNLDQEVLKNESLSFFSSKVT